ncbi:MAG: hypothetical protein MR487_03495 [Lachnospiraceae bacterium]|nr:hypothetical protein [Lachnospiraceae bacterium]
MNDENYIAEIRCYGAFDQEKDCLVGVIATRNNGNHITSLKPWIMPYPKGVW